MARSEQFTPPSISSEVRRSRGAYQVWPGQVRWRNSRRRQASKRSKRWFNKAGIPGLFGALRQFGLAVGAIVIHLIQENYATHKHPKVKAWLKRHRRFEVHFTSTSSSWMNLVERSFADLTDDVIRTGSFASVNELVRDIEAYLAERNANPHPNDGAGREAVRGVGRL